MNRLILSALILLSVFTGCKSEEEYPVGQDIPEPSTLSDLPRVYVTTPDSVAVNSKTEWISGSTIIMTDARGNAVMSATTAIRGRGNTTWEYPKKAYALGSKRKVCRVVPQWQFFG